MAYRHAIGSTAYVFNDLRDLLAKASPPRSGDRLAGIAAESAELDSHLVYGATTEKFRRALS